MYLAGGRRTVSRANGADVERLRDIAGGPQRAEIQRRAGISGRTMRAFLAGAAVTRSIERIAGAVHDLTAERLRDAGWAHDEVADMPLAVRLEELARLDEAALLDPDHANHAGLARRPPPVCAYAGCADPPLSWSEAGAEHRVALQRQRRRARRRSTPNP
jgi:hypothetical protein